MNLGSQITVADGDKPDVGSTPTRRAVRARRTVIALAILAVAIYFGFILMMTWR
ncbi:MAG: hypothetical protein WBE39_03210 [Candidatus Competibacter sp.]